MNQLNEHLGATAEQGQVGVVRGGCGQGWVWLDLRESFISILKDLSSLHTPHQRETSKVEWYNTMLNKLGENPVSTNQSSL